MIGMRSCDILTQINSILEEFYKNLISGSIAKRMTRAIRPGPDKPARLVAMLVACLTLGALLLPAVMVPLIAHPFLLFAHAAARQFFIVPQTRLREIGSTASKEGA
jgi:hypothetical protein